VEIRAADRARAEHCLKSLSRAPLVIQEIIAMGEEMARDLLSARDVVQISDPIQTDELIEEKQREFFRAHRGARTAVPADPAGAAETAGDPADAEAEAASPAVVGARTDGGEDVADGAHAALPVPGHPAPDRAASAAAVETLRPVERDISRVQKQLEVWPGARAEGVKDLAQGAAHVRPATAAAEEEFGASGASCGGRSRSSRRRTARLKPPRRN
jgi:hypothetical protein